MLCVVEIVIRIQMIAKKTSEQDFLSLEEDDLFSSLPKKKKKNPNYGSMAKKFKWVV